MPAPITTHELLFRFITAVYDLYKIGQRSENTLNTYCSLCGLVPVGLTKSLRGTGAKDFAPIFDRPAAELRPKEIRQWMLDIVRDIQERQSAQGCAGTRSANAKLSLLDTALKWGIAEEYLPFKEPATKYVTAFTALPRSRFLEPEEVEAIRTALHAIEFRRLDTVHCWRQQYIVSQTQVLLLISVTGMRLFEAMSLRVSQVDLKHAVIRLNKTKTGPREIPLADIAVEQLARQIPRAVDGWVFPSIYGGHVRDVYHIWTEALDLSQIDAADVVIHTLRHSVATYLLRRGKIAQDVQNILGHTDIRTTLNTYGRPLATDSARAAINVYAGAVCPVRRTSKNKNPRLKAA